MTRRHQAAAVTALAGTLLLTGCAAPETPSTVDHTPPATVTRARQILADLPTVPHRPTVGGYDRSCSPGHLCVFGPAWSDDVDVERGHNGCSTREDMLRWQLTDVVTETNGCVVHAGQFQDPYTGEQVRFTKANAGNVAVDHVVALAVAWDFGAHQWSAQQRRNFANDPRNLLVTTASTNAAKADRTPGLWHPDTAAGRCRFAQMYIEVLSVYGLPVTVDDRAALMEDLDACQ